MNESTDSTTTSGVRARASNLKRRVKDESKQKIESGKRAAADQIAEIADAIDVAGAQLDQSQPTLANYATRLADSVGGLATRLREDSVEDLYKEMRRIATRHPAMFMLGSAALGVLIARFMKASGEGAEEGREEGLGETAEYEAREEWGEGTVDIGGDGSAENPSLYGQASASGSATGTTFESPQRGV